MTGAAVREDAARDSVLAEARLDVPPMLAFDAFTRGLGEWWPREYTWSRDVLVAIGMDPRAGGLCHETGPNGFTCHWARVLAWEPPRRLVLAWQIAPTRAPEPDPARASEVEVAFAPEDGGTRVRLAHRGFHRHGEGADEYRRGMGSPFGWRYILSRYAAALADGEPDGGERPPVEPPPG